MKNLTLTILTVCLAFPSLTFSQDYQDEDLIFLNREEYITVKQQNHSFDIKNKVIERSKFLTTKKLYYANEYIHFDSFSEIKNINAYTLTSENEEVRVKYIETKREFENGVFYSDQQLKTFTFPAITENAITHLEYEEVSNEPRFLGMFRFGTYAPTQFAKISIEFPEQVQVGYRIFNEGETNIGFSKQKKGKKNIYSWQVNNVEAFRSEEDSESLLYYVPHIIIYIKSYTEDGKEHFISKDVNSLYDWYLEMVSKIDKNNLDEVYQLADEITASKKTPREKAKAIFKWVQDNINYVAFEDGLGGFVPRGSASVCKKRYGDCKDMANLLYEMLNHAGVPAYRAWIGTRNRQYTYTEVPTPLVDNHMITAAEIDGEMIFLDGTDEHISFGQPSSFTQGKEALIGIDDKTFKLIQVPEWEASKSVTQVESTITLNENTVQVSEVRNLSGYQKTDFIVDYKYDKETLTDEEFLNQKLKLGNNKTAYQNIEKANFDNSDIPLEISYDLEINNYTKTIGSKVFLNLNIDRVYSDKLIDVEKRRFSKKIDHKFKKVYTTTLNIPEGYTVNKLPEELKFENDDFGFEISYLRKGDQIIQNKTLYVNTLQVQNENFELWNQFIKSLVKAYKKSIILEKN